MNDFMTEFRCPTEYEYIFCDRAMVHIDESGDLTQLTTVSPSEKYPGYWDCERMVGAIADGFKKPTTKAGAALILRDLWKVSHQGWNITPHHPGHFDYETGSKKRELEWERKEVVYFLQAGPFIKIGFTAGHPKKRADDLKTGCPYPIEILGVIEGSQGFERTLHLRFSASRANLEWFHDSPSLRQFIETHAVQL